MYVARRGDSTNTNMSIGIPSRMVSVRIRDHWRPISRAIRLHALHSIDLWYNYTREKEWQRLIAMYRPSIRPRRIMVRYDIKAEQILGQICCWNGHLPDIHLWRLDICHFHRRPQLARYLHDFVPCRDVTMDIGMPRAQPT